MRVNKEYGTFLEAYWAKVAENDKKKREAIQYVIEKIDRIVSEREWDKYLD